MNDYNKPDITFDDDFTGIYVDIDVVIANHNSKNPNKEAIDRKKLAEILGVTKQVFVNWKAGKTPKLIYIIFKLMELGKMQFEDIAIKVQ